MPQHANFKFRPCYKTNLANTCFACLSELSSSCLHKSRLHIPNAANSDPTIQAIWHDKVHTEYTVKQLTQIGHISHGSGLVTHWPDIQKRLCMHFLCFQWPTRWHEMLQLPIRSWRRFAVTWNEWNINNVGAFIIVTSMIISTVCSELEPLSWNSSVAFCGPLWPN